MTRAAPTRLETLYPYLLRLLNWLPAETAHHLGLFSLKYLPLQPRHYHLPVRCAHLTWPNPVGLAAGLDKNGDYIDALGKLGFGFIEVGTVTPQPQPGNPKPRLFRISHEQALLNRLGFNNKGLEYLKKRLAKRRYAGILGVNIGKNATTPLAQAVDDYRTCLAGVYPLCDYVTVNLSSPNTPGLRELQNEHYLNDLLKTLKTCQAELAQQHQRYVPLLVKIAPDLTVTQCHNMARILLEVDIDGVICTNTTVDKSRLRTPQYRDYAGGLSGQPLTQMSNQVLASMHQALGDSIPIIGVGGILSAADARNKLQMGASLLQLYTGFIYQGPKLIREIMQGVAHDATH